MKEREYDYEKIYDVVKYILIWKRAEENFKRSIEFNKLIIATSKNENLKIGDFESYSQALKSDEKEMIKSKEKREMLEQKFLELIK